MKTGLPDDERIEILDGLSDGERVVTAGALALRDGDRVTLVGDPTAAGARRVAGAAAAAQGSATAAGGGDQQLDATGRDLAGV